MSYEVKSIAVFERQAKKLSRKYPSFKDDLRSLILELKEKPQLGKALGNNCFKIRMAIKSKSKGKSGGGRVITCFRIERDTVFLLSVFDKSEQVTISNRELFELLDAIPN